MNTYDKWETTATVNDETRAEKWIRVFGKNQVPLKSILPTQVTYDGKIKLAYEVDVNAITEEQTERIADVFGISKEEFVNDCKAGRKLYIDGENVTVSSTDQSMVIGLMT